MLVFLALWTAAGAAPVEAPVRAMGVECHPFNGRGGGHGSRSPAEYPPSALRRHEQGSVLMCVRVETDGRVGDCTILRSSGYADLDKGSCDMALSRFRFTPAHDDNGNPVPDGMQVKLNWVLP